MPGSSGTPTPRPGRNYRRPARACAPGALDVRHAPDLQPWGNLSEQASDDVAAPRFGDADHVEPTWWSSDGWSATTSSPATRSSVRGCRARPADIQQAADLQAVEQVGPGGAGRMPFTFGARASLALRDPAHVALLRRRRSTAEARPQQERNVSPTRRRRGSAGERRES